jgi:outer membrane protein OmpA-like peptidoglycan-associated protein
MKHFLGGSFVFALWTTASLYFFSEQFISRADQTEATTVQETVIDEPVEDLASSSLAVYENGDAIFQAMSGVRAKASSPALQWNPQGYQLLDDLASYLQEEAGKSLVVITHYDINEAGQEHEAMEWAMRRGDELRRELQFRDVSASRISLLANADSELFQKNRPPFDVLLVEEERVIEFLAMQAAEKQLAADDLALSLTRHIRFDYGTSFPEEDPAVAAYLDQLGRWLNQDADRTVEVIGHTCSVSSSRFNLQLGLGRAQSVKQMLVDRGVRSERIDAVSKGEEHPIADNSTESGQKANRRVEIRIR